LGSAKSLKAKSQTNFRTPILVMSSSSHFSWMLVFLLVLFVYSAERVSGSAMTVDDYGRELVQFASAAYCPQGTLERWSFSPNCSSMQNSFQFGDSWYAGNTDALGYVAVDHSSQIVVVAFKGTDPADIIDWIDDLNGAFSYNTTCQVSDTLSFRGSTGFCDYYMSLRDLGLFEYVQSFIADNPSYQLYVVGHSLGGAAAVIHALDVLYNANPTQLTLITFGEPRVGDFTVSQLFSQAPVKPLIYRFVHDRDIVPHLPWCCDAGNSCSDGDYCPLHEPTEVWYQSAMGVGAPYKVCSSTNGEDFSCSDQDVDYSIPDHLVYFELDVGSGCC